MRSGCGDAPRNFSQRTGKPQSRRSRLMAGIPALFLQLHLTRLSKLAAAIGHCQCLRLERSNGVCGVTVRADRPRSVGVEIIKVSKANLEPVLRSVQDPGAI